jgi:hypothetical protein
MKIGDKVKVTATSCFQGREGTIIDTRKGPLPLGIRGIYSNRTDRRGLVWFDPKELEVIE